MLFASGLLPRSARAPIALVVVGAALLFLGIVLQFVAGAIVGGSPGEGPGGVSGSDEASSAVTVIGLAFSVAGLACVASAGLLTWWEVRRAEQAAAAATAVRPRSTGK